MKDIVLLSDDTTAKPTARRQAEYLAESIYVQCGCTKYEGHPGCKHDRMYEDAVKWFMAGAAWQKDQSE